MVSLRERKARPSYAIISEGLANLTSEEEDSDDDNEAGGDVAKGKGDVEGGGIGESSTGPRIKKERKGSVSSSASESGGEKVDEIEDDSMSSGDSSEFAPSDGDDGKGKKRKKGRGGPTKKTVQDDSASSGSDSEYEAEGVAEELRELDDDEMLDEEGEQDDSGLDILGTPPGSPSGGHARSKLSKTKTGKPTITPRLPPPGLDNNPGRRINRTLAAPPVYLQSDLNLLLPAYRQFIKSSAEGMVKAPPVRVWSYEKHKVISSEGFPSGNSVPFVTRLTAPPGEKGGRVKVVKAEEREKRRRKAIELEKEMIIGLGWEAWEGEGWWPEMFCPEGRGGGKLGGVVKGWKLREEVVGFGLDDVGRYKMEELVFVDEGDRQRYLPGSSRGTATIVHLGPHDNQKPVTIDIFQQVNMQNHPLKEGYIFSAGGPIWGMDWCPVPSDQGGGQIGIQYLAVTTLPNIESKAPMGEKCSREATSAIQIWSVSLPHAITRDPGGMRCEILLCVEGGHGMACKWMPMGARDQFDPADQDQTLLPKLGVLAVIQLDGSISVYSVPHPLAVRSGLGNAAGDRNKPLFLQCHDPLLRIELADTTGTCMDWLTGSKLAVGYSNGSVGIWDIATALKEGERENILPHVYVNVAQSCIASIAVGRMPPSDINGSPIYNGEPTKIVIGSHDGSFAMLDMRSPHQPVILGRSRIPCLTVGWTGQSQCPLYTDSEYNIIIYKIRGIPTQRNATVTPHRGPIWDMSSSEYHTMLATAGSDGSVIIAPMQLGLYRYRKQPLCTWRSLEMDYDKHTGLYRLTDNFLPENTSLDTAHGRKTRVGKLVGKDSPITLKVGQWAPHVGVHKVAWNNSGGIARAGMLAVGTASGLGIVDIISPRWKTWAPHVQEYFGS